jgi:hypothetical protein
VRLLTRQPEYSDEEDLMRWANVVCRNLMIDLKRKEGRHFAINSEPLAADVELTVIGRAELSEVRRVWSSLSEPDRAALSGNFSRDPGARSTSATRMAVSRARAKLRNLTGYAVTLIGHRLRRLRIIQPITQEAAAALCSLVPLLFSGISGGTAMSAATSAARPLVTTES